MDGDDRINLTNGTPGGDEKFTLIINSSLLRQLREISHREKMTGRQIAVRDLIGEAVRLWLKQKEEGSVPDSEQRKKTVGSDGTTHAVLLFGSVDRREDHSAISFPQEFFPWVRRLLHILEKNHPKAAPAIQSNLVAFEELTDLGGQIAPPPSDPDTEKLSRAQESVDDLLRATTNAEDYTEKLKKSNPKRRRAS